MLVPSPKVATYDLKPEMSAAGIAGNVVKAVGDSAFDVVIVNFANADMVGHSGKIPPTVKAVETVDACLGEIYTVEVCSSQVGIFQVGTRQICVAQIGAGEVRSHQVGIAQICTCERASDKDSVAKLCVAECAGIDHAIS